MQQNGNDLTIGFNASFYTKRHADLAGMGDEQALQHFLAHGHKEQRFQNPIAGRELLIRQVPTDRPSLEIGPFGAPQLHGPRVRYADYLSTEELQARAPAHGFDPTKCPTIHYVLGKTPLGSIQEQFAAVFSSHCIEHQPDLVTHLQDVSQLLEACGCYYLIVPDKRFCFDHFIPESNISDVLVAHAERRTRHTLRSILNGMGLSTHNDAPRHWRGDHGSPTAYTDVAAAINGAKAAYEDSVRTGRYMDVHAWQFTPRGFQSICTDLRRMGLTDLRLIDICSPMWERNEFCTVLQKAG